MSKPLTQAKIKAALATGIGGAAGKGEGGLDAAGWTVKRDALAKTFKFAGFKEAMAFMVRVGFEAEAMNHHPEWTNVYNRVAVRLNTHDAGGKVTAKDVELARRMDAVFTARA